MLESRFIESMASEVCIWGFILRCWGRPWLWPLILAFISLCGDSVISMNRLKSFRPIRKCWFPFLAVVSLGLGPGSTLTPLITSRPSFSPKTLRQGSTRIQLIAWRSSTRRKELGLFSRVWEWQWSGHFQWTGVGLWLFSLWWGDLGGGGTRKQQSDKL